MPVVSAGLLALGLQGCGGALATGSAGPEAKAGPETVVERPVGEPLQRIENATLADVLKPGPLGDHVIGRSDAPVALIYYVSHTCPYCRAFNEKALPALKKQYVDTGRVRLIVREFPIGKTSGVAAMANRCIDEPKFLPLLNRYLSEQSRWVSQEVRRDPIFEVARKEGMTRTAFDSCLANQSIIDGLKWVKERGRQLGVIGTPTFFVQEKRLRTNPSLSDLQRELDHALARGATAQSAPRPR